MPLIEAIIIEQELYWFRPSVMTIGIQAAMNIGVVTNALPTTGIPLPFISAGGTSLLLSAAAAGVLVNIAEQTCGTQR
jgi:cell division protein FtsW (lipid II flippase)